MAMESFHAVLSHEFFKKLMSFLKSSSLTPSVHLHSQPMVYTLQHQLHLVPSWPALLLIVHWGWLIVLPPRAASLPVVIVSTP